MELGDKILFYTDGLTEGINSRMEEFGAEIPQILLKNANLPIEKLIEKIYYFFLLHCEKDILDDVCMVGIEVEK